MAKQEIVMPQMGESITNGTITKWHKQPGDTIQIDEILLEISTDKVESEIPSPFEGRIEEILFPEGDTVDVGIKIAVLEDDLSVPFSGGSSSSTSAAPAKVEVAVEQNGGGTAVALAEVETSNAQVEAGRRFYTPLVKALAKENGVDLGELANIVGTGAGGRVNKEDFMSYLQNRGAGAPAAAPAARTAPAPAAPAPTSVPAGGVAQTLATGERVEIIPMDNMRKAIAKNMVESKLTSPHVNSLDEIDMTKLVKFREGFKNEFKRQEGFSLTYTHFILYALVQALREHPMVNASIDGTNIVVKKDINLGCAVAVPGNGLVVPVIKSADSLNITGIARKVNELAAKARNRKLTLDELSGGTFTFTNVGSFGTLMATPVILQPQLGIFASGVIKKRPIVTEDDAIAIRHMMYSTHTYDHRLIDGELGGRFLASVKHNLENMDPSALF
ncbi:MAG: 2-oxo acid dehydrogenase subunit E2 [Deltaproteobacteria bacterium]|nr:MAG: 2-oxo acid dehydrogenase subunit E2 [Deltaproteobacteria bacterium]TNF28769.1 MAG: 2-oxo acid dehydrogenase subunit E2 [Deltaproteobacteria bacterium]